MCRPMVFMANGGMVIRSFCQTRHDESGCGVEHAAGFIAQTFGEGGGGVCSEKIKEILKTRPELVSGPEN